MIKSYFKVFITELKKITSYRSVFWINFFGQSIFGLLIAYALWESFYATSTHHEVNGLNFKQMVFFSMLAPLVFRTQQGMGIGSIFQDIYSGGLNKYLIYPTSFIINKLFKNLAHSFFYFAQIIFFIFLYSFYDAEFIKNVINIQKIVMFFMAMAVSSITYFYMNAICEYTAFWAENIWSLGVMLQITVRFLGGGLIPLAFFSSSFQQMIQFTPFPYLVNFPIQILMQNVPMNVYLQNMALNLFWLLFFSYISNVVWERGKYQYAGAGM